MKALHSILIGIALSGCGASETANVGAPTGNGAVPGGTLSERHPGDVGIGTDPAVVWYEDFEAASVAAVTGRYDQSQGAARMTLVADHAPGSTGMALALRAGGGVDAVDLFKQLPDHDELYVRWYAKYEAGAPWHHSGVWVGGYNPSARFPSPHAGERPNGDDRFSISIEPVWGTGGANPRFDF